MQKPSIGRIVHYVDFTNQHLAAVITKVDGETVHLAVFNPSMGDTEWLYNVQFDESAQPNTCHWPEREA